VCTLDAQVIVRGLKAKNNHSDGDLYGNNGDEVSRRKQRKKCQQCKNMVFISWTFHQ
jgi:hypothetical protein